MAPTRHGNDLYVLAGGIDPERDGRAVFQLVRTPLDGAPVRLLGKVYPNLKNVDPARPGAAFWRTPRFITQCACDGRWLVAGTLYDGMYAFPLSGGDAVRVGEQEGLPGLKVPVLTVVDGKVLAFVEEGYLVVYDLKAGRCEVVASSRRTTPQSPFDNDRPFRVSVCLADPERGRAVFTVKLPAWDHPKNGTWEYRFKSGAFKNLLPMFHYRASTVREEQVILANLDGGWLGRFDLATDRFVLLTGKSPLGFEAQEPIGLPAGLTAAMGDRLYHGGFLWKASPFSRQPLRGGKEEFFAHVRNPQAAGASFTECLDCTNGGDLLVADRRGVYLVRWKK